MANSLELVKHDLLQLDMSSFISGLEYDIANAKLKHDYEPARNFINVEFKLPSIQKQLSVIGYSGIAENHFYQNYHNIQFNLSDNTDFRRILRDIPHDKIRHYDKDTKVYTTYYYSKVHKLRAMVYDYEATLVISMMYPKSEYMRRRTCAKLNNKCKKCPKMVASDVGNYTGDFYEYWFKQIGDVHGQLIAYSTEKVFEFDFQKDPYEPTYHIIDLDNTYFSLGVSSKSRWEQNIYASRVASQREMYFSCSNKIEAFEEDYLSGVMPVHPSFFGEKVGEIILKHRGLELYKYSSSELLVFLVDEYGSAGFDSMSHFDINTLHHRHSWHKFIYNYWSVTKSDLSNEKDEGLYCSWTGTDAVVGSITSASDSGLEADMANAAMGISPGSQAESLDTEYELIQGGIFGYDYPTFFEKHPSRGITFV